MTGLRLVPDMLPSACTRKVQHGSGWVAQWLPCGKDLATEPQRAAALCGGHLRSAKAAATAAARVAGWTPARHRWLTDVRTGLVRAYICGVTDIAAGWNGDMVYPSDHPAGRRAEVWLCQPEVRTLWRGSNGPTRLYRVMLLTGEGRRVLASWDSDHGVAGGETA